MIYGLKGRMLPKGLSMEDYSFLFELERQLHSTEVRCNVPRITSLLSPGFIEFGSSGNVWTLKDILERLPSEDQKNEIESFDYIARKLSHDVILVTYVSKRISEKGTTESLRSSIWKHSPLGWQMEFHQGTPRSNN